MVHPICDLCVRLASQYFLHLQSAVRCVFGVVDARKDPPGPRVLAAVEALQIGTDIVSNLDEGPVVEPSVDEPLGENDVYFCVWSAACKPGDFRMPRGGISNHALVSTQLDMKNAGCSVLRSMLDEEVVSLDDGSEIIAVRTEGTTTLPRVAAKVPRVDDEGIDFPNNAFGFFAEQSTCMSK